jgi:8-oxo-dGTP pyrophosphatase MutT (NUDIX family)
MRWTVHGERILHDSEWVSLRLVDVELPSGSRFEHYAVRIPREAAAVVAVDPARGVLLLWRHRFITDSWGWEVPGGEIDPGETPAEAAVREMLEETGWRPGPFRDSISWHPMPGRVDQRFHAFLADGATHEGERAETDEAERIEWLSPDQVRRLVREGQITDGYSLVALLWFLAIR